MEAHLVHFNSKYSNLQTAVTKKDGLAVVAFFIQSLGDVDCILFSKITDHIENIRKHRSKCAIAAGDLLIKASKSKFFLFRKLISRLFKMDVVARAQQTLLHLPRVIDYVAVQ